MNEQIKIGDMLESTTAHTLARRLLVTEVSADSFKAVVLEGENTREPITVFKAGWSLYTRTAKTK